MGSSEIMEQLRLMTRALAEVLRAYPYATDREIDWAVAEAKRMAKTPLRSLDAMLALTKDDHEN